MASFIDQYLYYPERRTARADVVGWKRNKPLVKELLFAGTQVAGGAALAYYTYKNSPSLIWPSVYSVVTLGGTYNVLRSIRKIFWRSASNEGETCSLNNVATGTIIYFGSLYAFSEAWRIDHDLWMPCLGSASLGFFYAVSSTYSTKMKLLLKCCRLSFEPVLIVAGAVYLKFFRSHQEDWVYLFPLAATGLTGFKYTYRGLFTIIDDLNPSDLLLLGIELLMGGCMLTVSSIVLAIYVSMKEIHQFLVSYALAIGSLGAYVLILGIVNMVWLAGVDLKLAAYVGCMLAAPVTIFVAFLFVQCTEYKRVAYAMLPFLAGGGYYLLLLSLFELPERLPWPVFVRYCQRTWGLMLMVSGSAASAFTSYRFGLRSSLWMTPVVSTGIYITYKGFS